MENRTPTYFHSAKQLPPIHTPAKILRLTKCVKPLSMYIMYKIKMIFKLGPNLVEFSWQLILELRVEVTLKLCKL